MCRLLLRSLLCHRDLCPDCLLRFEVDMLAATLAASCFMSVSDAADPDTASHRCRRMCGRSEERLLSTQRTSASGVHSPAKSEQASLWLIKA